MSIDNVSSAHRPQWLRKEKNAWHNQKFMPFTPVRQFYLKQSLCNVCKSFLSQVQTARLASKATLPPRKKIHPSQPASSHHTPVWLSVPARIPGPLAVHSCEESTGCPRYCPRALQCVHSPGWGKAARDERARKKGLEKQCYMAFMSFWMRTLKR